ncbi:MAG: hypothetical protein CMN75_07380 [Spirochaeta sp.]|nr:hypothetical protein [Spirochaeta sp.]RPG05330.1 MAG: alpha/beta fold hydrolase [Proteobacteria bacterium TMED72]
MGALFETLHEGFSYWAQERPDVPAILAPDRDPLSFGRLLAEMESLASCFNRFGIGRGDAVAIVMPQSVEQQFLIMGLAVSATAVPLNPAYTQAEFEDQFASFGARGLLVEAGSTSPAVAAAQACGIPVFESTAEPERSAGLSSVEWKSDSAPTAEAKPESFASATSDDVALIVLTSGTTAQSKPVPLTQKNLCASVALTTAHYGLSPSDRCVRIMPLFHVFGCIHQGFIPLLSGGSLVSLLDFAPALFGDVLREFAPTWFGATPTFHRAILDELARAPLPEETKKVRFILSGGSGGTASLAAQADEIYRAPLIEAYGLSEGAGLSTANPLGEGRQQPGSVGFVVGKELGQEIAILGPGHKVLSPRKVGEVVIRGPNVFSGYLNMPEENAELFVGDWMRTGDLGELDARGFLYLAGRVKEIINRGGEKISPAGVDDELTLHPDVEAAVTFAVPDDRLGEDVASAVVLREGASLTKSELRKFAAQRLAHFKVPHQIIFIKESDIPRNATGKPLRGGLAEHFGMEGRKRSEAEGVRKAPSSETEEKVVVYLSGLLQVENVGVDEDFFDLGGDSLSALTLTQWIQEEFGIEMRPVVLFEAASVEALASLIEAGHPGSHDGFAVALSAGESSPAVFCIPGIFGDVIGFRKIARALGSDVPFYGLERQGFYGEAPVWVSWSRMAKAYAAEILRLRPEGPHILMGYSIGGVIAYEVAQRLNEAGSPPALLALMDTGFPEVASEAKKNWLGEARGISAASISRLLRKPLDEWSPMLRGNLLDSLWQAQKAGRLPFLSESIIYALNQRVGVSSLERSDKLISRRYRCKKTTDIPTVLFYTEGSLRDYGTQTLGWDRHILGPFEQRPVPGDHFSLQGMPAAQVIGDTLREKVDAIRQTSEG